MFKLSKSDSIPNLRKKRSLIDLGPIDIQSCMVILFITILILASIVYATAIPNSNFPAGV
ncbi:hypothetical protein HYG87_07390 [Methanobacterium alkalithermotolerans]|uniref:Uncharacterized protein n=1 Tax=Methanobacterium alkalithermotolerans TaxID=2731220 RepID=A0A8T8K4V2_9EURY|nr:hypothetical protein [Methanobacterium alkalithermotolerans]QUH23596.1 hypothetical protein HYG87_07390 [Methanobacterium alkalithermotolerans]RJS49845.1 MAG: hypothetical protein CIT03_01570 [Methanobacterium sp.]